LADASDVRKAAAAGMKRGEPAFLAPFCGSALLCFALSLGKGKTSAVYLSKDEGDKYLWEMIMEEHTDMLVTWHNVGSGAERISSTTAPATVQTPSQ